MSEEGTLVKRQPALPAQRPNARLARIAKSFKRKPEIEFPLYAIATDTQEVARVISENMGAQGLTEFDLERIKIPTGGRTKWELPSLDGEAEDAKTFEGIIVFHKDSRRFWKESYDESGGGVPPDCASESDEHGHMFGRGDPGGPCDACPNAEFGSAQKGRGQACRLCRPLFVIRSGETLPVVIPLPPTSLAPCRKFFAGLSSRSIPYYAVVIKFGLKEARSQAGQMYAEIVFSASGILDPERPDKKTLSQVELVEAYQEQVMPGLRKVRMPDTDFNNTQNVDEAIRERDGPLPSDDDISGDEPPEEPPDED